MTTEKLVLTVIGLQRSGNHAVIDWLGSLFSTHAFFNNNPHDLYADAAALEAMIAGCPEPCVIFSFEDSPGKMADPALPLVRSVRPFPPIPGVRARTLFILRDPYNQWASRVMGRRSVEARGTALTSDPAWEKFCANWQAFAALQAEQPEDFILFNHWYRDRAYRREVCAALGGRYSEATLGHIPAAGGGSSFDALPRKSYGQMLQNLRHYVSPDFLRKLASRPAYYVKRLLSPPASGAQLKVEDRWKGLRGDPEAAALFADDALGRAARRIFGPAGLPEESDK